MELISGDPRCFELCCFYQAVMLTAHVSAVGVLPPAHCCCCWFPPTPNHHRLAMLGFAGMLFSEGVLHMNTLQAWGLQSLH
jgi:hypothetical protein